jgi:hypothetical protein
LKTPIIKAIKSYKTYCNSEIEEEQWNGMEWNGMEWNGMGES